MWDGTGHMIVAAVVDVGFCLFVCCTVRNTYRVYIKVTGNWLPVHLPLLLKVKTRKSQVTYTEVTSLHKTYRGLITRL